MTIGINGFEAVKARFGYDKKTGIPNRVGSSEVCFQLINEFSKDKKNEYIVYLPKKPTSDMPEESENLKYKILPDRKLWTISSLTIELLKKPKLDVFFSPTHYAPLYAPCPQIISILDVSYKHYPEMFGKKDLVKLALWGKYSIKKARSVVTISESSRNDIINEYKVSKDKVEVVHLGIKDVEESKMTNKEFIKKYKLKNPYILFVGTLQPRKNIPFLVEAFSKIVSSGKYKVSGMENLDLVIVGRKGWAYEETLNAPEKYDVKERVHFIDSVNNAELPAFYENAVTFVMPSLYEGFGLPVLEAMRYECPVVSSNVSSLPEAGGDAAEYFDPKDVNDAAKKIEKVVSSKDKRQEMVKKGKEQVKKFSWEKSAREVLQIFEKSVEPVESSK